MKKTTFKKGMIGIFSAMFVFFAGWQAYSGQGKLEQTIKSATMPFNDEKKVDSVIPIPKDTVLARVKYQGGRFRVETRKDKIERFNCSECHNSKFKKVDVERAAEMAHGDIKLVHGGREKPLDCMTCHHPDARDYLTTEKGSKVDMDHSYQLCGQCHFRQKDDWAGGAHGKRVSYWAGKRVVKNCTYCHDPHSPRFEKRWPKTYSRPFLK